MKDTRTRAQQNRAIRQEALREQLSKQGHVQKVVELLAKVEDATQEVDIQRTKLAIDTRLSLIKKYLPDIKAVEHSGEGGQQLVINIPESIAKTS